MIELLFVVFFFVVICYVRGRNRCSTTWCLIGDIEKRLHYINVVTPSSTFEYY